MRRVLFAGLTLQAVLAATAPAPAEARTTRSADGVRIAYDVRGNGPVAVVLVHGWSCDRTYWKGQLAPLAGPYRVVTVDLAGHGASGAGREAWTIASFGDDVAAVVQKLGLRRVVLVGHSMGGDVIAEAARRLPGRVIGLVWVDTYKSLGTFRTPEQAQAMVARFRADFPRTTRAFVREMFPRTADPALVERVAADMSAAPPAVALGALASAIAYDREMPATLRVLDLPVVAINPDRPPSDQVALARHGVALERMSGVGHFPMLEAPERFNALLVKTVGELVRGRSTPSMSVLDAVGETSLVRLRTLVPPGSADVLVKLEWENPTGSMKDRMARAVIAAAEADGRLRPGGTVVEYTGGSTGTSLALVCAARGYRIRIVTSEAFSQEKRDHMAALGAELTLVPSEGGLTTKKLILDMIETARVLAREPGTFWTNQLENHDSIAGYFPLAEEIWRQTEGRVDAFVHGVGTGASVRGVATVLKRKKPAVRAVAVEPAESPVLAGGAPGPHKIEGVGVGYVPPLWEPSLVDGIEAVATADAKEMARRLAREEGLFAGTSSGANVVAALRVAERLGAGATVVTLLCDSGLKYLSTDVYRER